MSKKLPESAKTQNATLEFYNKMGSRIDNMLTDSKGTMANDTNEVATNTVPNISVKEENQAHKKGKNKYPCSFSFSLETIESLRAIAYIQRKSISEITEEVIVSEVIDKSQTILEEFRKLPDSVQREVKQNTGRRR